MRSLVTLSITLALALACSPAISAEITGEYLEARTCDVYTGPCFANGEMALAGKEAVMAWKVDKGSWKGVSLDRLAVALVVKSEGTLGDDGVFPMQAGKIESAILVDESATSEQSQALVAFVKDSAKHLAANVVHVQRAALELTNDHLEGRGIFKAGDLAQIETRALDKGDCVCSNEMTFYQPLVKVQNSSPAYAKTLSYEGEGLSSRWRMHNGRSAFLATFRR
jgi:hypothetical protein